MKKIICFLFGHKMQRIRRTNLFYMVKEFKKCKRCKKEYEVHGYQYRQNFDL